VRGHFSSGEAASKLLFLVLREVSQNWKMASRKWNAAKTQFAVMFGDRFVAKWVPSRMWWKLGVA
jgi:putative transposase